MTINEICIEQNRFNQASTMSGCNRGATVWMPFDMARSIWQGWELKPNAHAATDGVACWGLYNHWMAKFCGGSYIPAVYNDATYGRPAALAYSGAWTDLVSKKSTGSTTGWHSVYRAATDRTITVTVPAGTTRLYMNVAPRDLVTCSVTVISGTATLVKNSFNCAISGDFGPEHTGGIADNWALIATNCGGAEIRFVRGEAPTASEYLSICGWIAINDSIAGDPGSGVFDPTTVVNIEPASSDAEGPLVFKFGSGGTAFFWGFGGSHWTSTNTLTSSAELKVYDTAAADSVAGVFANNTQVNTVATSFSKILTGNIQVKNGAAAADTVGTYRNTYTFTPRGLVISIRYAFNASVLTNALRIPTTTSVYSYGGYIGQWALTAQFNKFKLTEDPSMVSVVAPWDDSYPVGGYSAAIVGYAPSLRAAARFTARGRFYNITKTVSNSYMSVLKRTQGFPKIYTTLGNVADITLADGDVVEATQVRQVMPLRQEGQTTDYEL